MGGRGFEARLVAIGWGGLVVGAAATAASCGDVVALPIGAGPPAVDAADSDIPFFDTGPDHTVALEGGDSSAPHDGGDGAVRVDATPSCNVLKPIPVPGTAFCTGDLAVAFRFAACACGSLDISGDLVTDTIGAGGDASAGVSASIGANGAVAINTHTMVGGSMWAGGANLQSAPSVGLHGDGTIAGDVHAGASVDVGGPFQVGGDLFANGAIVVDDPDGGDSLSVAGAVHLPSGDAVSPGVSAKGGIVRQPVSMGPPCDCSNPIPVISIVSAFKNTNDDALIGLGTGGLENPPAPVALPCGRYYVYGIAGGNVELQVSGSVALFVDGNLNIDGSLQVDLPADAELDLFVAGSMVLGNGAMLGNVNSPGRVRVYVGGAVQLGDMIVLGANIYAPTATITSSDLQMSGSLFAGQFNVSSLGIHYDPSVLATTGCRATGGSCSVCDDCSGSTPACVKGACSACTGNSDCCAPFVCSGGRCVQPGP